MRRTSGLVISLLVAACGSGHGPIQGHWETLPQNPDIPSGLHSAAWTGSELLVWGGTDCDSPCADGQGGVLELDSRQWRRMTPDGEPSARYATSTAWTGSELLVWGGFSYDLVGTVSDGALYDPASNRWRASGTTDAPTARMLASAVWTGKEVVIWGGMTFVSVNMARTSPNRDLGEGAAFDPILGRWRALSTSNAPSGRTYHSVVWAKDRMVVWGGVQGDPPNERALRDGAAYHPSSDTWTKISDRGALGARWGALSAWTGTEMIIWGGQGCGGGPNPTSCHDGAAYNPSTDSWRALPAGPDEGIAGDQSAAVWTGRHVILWGTESGRGWLYDPSVNQWIEMTPAPPGFAPRSNFSAVWTGEQMLVWGGLTGDPALPRDDGAAYTP
jgi:hypothetical protein